MKKVILKLRAKHFEKANYTDPCNCGISFAARDQLNATETNIGVEEGRIDDIWYTYSEYGFDHFSIDARKAKEANHPDVIIRTITLKPYHDRRTI